MDCLEFATILIDIILNLRRSSLFIDKQEEREDHIHKYLYG